MNILKQSLKTFIRKLGIILLSAAACFFGAAPALALDGNSPVVIGNLKPMPFNGGTATGAIAICDSGTVAFLARNYHGSSAEVGASGREMVAVNVGRNNIPRASHMKSAFDACFGADGWSNAVWDTVSDNYDDEEGYGIQVTVKDGFPAAAVAPGGVFEVSVGTLGALTPIFDTTPPTATISPFTGPFSGKFRAAITLSEASTDFSLEDLMVTNGTVVLTGNGTTYEATVTPAADGDITLQVKGGSFSDAAGNMNSGTSNTITINADLTPPTATIADFVGPDANGRYTAAITLSESSNVFVGEGQKAASFTVDDLEVTNGTVTLVQIDKTVSFSATVTPGDGSEIALQVKAGSFSDEAGNLNAEASNRVTVTFDSTPPTAAISPFSAQAYRKFKADITLSEASADFTHDDFNVTNGTVTLTGSGTSYEATVFPAAEGNVTLQIKSGSFSDAAGNVNVEPSNSISASADLTRPTASIAEFQGPDADGNFSAVITLSESSDVVGADGVTAPSFTVDALYVQNGTVTLTGSGTVFTALVTPGDGPEITIQVGTARFFDAAGNSNIEVSNQVTLILDMTPPTAAISPFTGPVDGKYRAAVTLSEVSTDFDLADLNVTNATVTLSGSGTTYEATVTPTADGDVTLQIKDGSFSDAAGNVNAEASNTVTATFDSTPPTATIAAFSGPADGKYTAAITLSEEAVEFVGEGQQVASFTVDDLTVTNGTVTLTGSGKSYTATVTPSADGDVTLQVKVSSFQDAAGNKNAEASNTVKVTYDGTPPTAAISALEGPVDGVFTASITLSEVSTDFTVDDLAVTNGTVVLTGSGTAYTATVTPLEDGEITLQVKAGSFADAASNANAETSNAASADFDGTSPTVVLSGQPNEIRDATAFTINVTFSESITGFTASDITVENGSATSLSGSSPNYVATITPTGGGDVTISVAAGVVEDLAKNPNIASEPITIKNVIAEITQKLIANAAYSRAINLIANQPNLTGFMVNAVETGDFDANVTNGNGILSFKNNADSPVWVQGHGSWSQENDLKTKYAFGAIGKHMKLSENAILGAMAQFDYAKSKDGVQDHESFGWLVGPYIVAKVPDQPLYFEGSALAGQTDNDVNPIGTYTDNYSSNRWMLNGKVTGRVKQKGYTLEPNINVNMVQDKTESYTDSLGNNILGSNIKIAQGSIDLDARIPMAVDNGKLEWLAGVAAVYSDASGSGGAANVVPAFEGGRARLDAGIDRKWKKSSVILTGFYDGVGASNYESYGANVRVTTVF